MKINVTEFKSKCTQFIREVESRRECIEITKNGIIVAIVSPVPKKAQCNEGWGSLKGSILKISTDFDEPLGDADWEAAG